MIEIRQVRTQGDADAVYRLAYEFIDWLRVRYPEMATEIKTYMVHQKFDQQIKDVLTHFSPPRGECLLAIHKGEPVGVLMLKDVGENTCEMNRMFVRQSARGLGAGRTLLQNLIRCAEEMGFQRMILTALPRHHEALPLYRSVGFQLDNRSASAGETDDAVLMRLDLHPQ